MKHIELEPLELEVGDNYYVRSCNIKRIENETLSDQKILWFKFDKSVPPPQDNDCDAYLLAIILDAMNEGRDVIVRGDVSRELLSNLVEYQAVKNKWSSEIYSLVNISVDSVRDNDIALPGAICAFSGGVDATFSVWRHSQKKLQYRSQEIKLCVMAHGLDIILTDQITFDNTFKKAKKTLRDINLNILPIQTNYRDIATAPWKHSYGCALVAALNNFKQLAGTCIIGSSETYDRPVIPSGSSPISDHLLSSGGFKVMYDGASYGRTEKVKAISMWKIAVENLHVCWEKGFEGENCGECEKCIRTKLNFLAAGLPIPRCFPNHNDADFSPSKVKRWSESANSDWKQIYEYAKKNNVKGAWLTQLHKIVWKRSIADIYFPQDSYRRKFAKKLKNRFGG